MQDSRLKTTIEDLLKQDANLWRDNLLNESLFIDKVNQLDTGILALLESSPAARSKFFRRINDRALVFHKDAFLLFWQENKTFNSYTKFLNRIGLGVKASNKFIIDNPDVVLNFPFKDCVLKGGQTKEDAKENEIFYNDIIAQDEIDRLFEEKAFDNFKRIDKDGEHRVVDLAKYPPPRICLLTVTT